VDKKQDEFKVKVDTKYGKYVKLGIAMLTTFGLIGTGAHQAGFCFPHSIYITLKPSHLVFRASHYFSPLRLRSNWTLPTSTLS
jgi:hypothetical protein